MALAGTRLALAAAVAATVFLALLPGDDRPQLLGWDKAEHYLAFLAITSLAVLALPRMKVATVALAALALGILIELAQSTPWIGRDGDVKDVVADLAGIATVVGLPVLARMRRWLAAD